MLYGFFQKSLLFFVILSTAFSAFPAFIFVDWLKIGTAFAAENGDGKIFYSISADTTPRTRDYTFSTNTFATAASTVTGATAIQSEIKASPTRDEFVAGYVNSTGTLQVMCWNGTSWSNEWSVVIGPDATTRRFDIAYETNSGDVMVLYGTNTAPTNELAYRTKPGSSACGSANWSGATNLDVVRTSGVVHWVKLAWDRRASSDLIAATWADTNADLSAIVWSGTAWVNEPSAASETTLEFITADQDVEAFDIEYESTSGDIMLVWANSVGANGTNGVRYNVCTGGTSTCTWGSVATPPTWVDDAQHLDISADPNSNQIIFASMGSGADLQYGVWSGTAWTNTANADISSTIPLAGTMFVATGWLISGANTRGVVAYYDGGATNIGWHTLSGTTWTAQTDFAASPVFGVQKNYNIEMDPINKDRLIFSVNDADSDIHAKRLILSGTTFTWSNSTGGGPIEANTSSAIYKTFDFAYYRHFATTLADGSNPSSVTIAPGNPVTDLDVFTLATNAGTDTVTAVTVTLAPSGAFNNIAQVDLTDNSNIARCTAVTNLASNTVSFSTCTANGGIPVTTTATTYKVRITPKTHANMPAVPGASYATTGTVTSFTSTNRQLGSDGGSATVTVDNLSPSSATSVSGTDGGTQVTLNWTTSASTDFSRSVMLRWSGSSPGSEVPAEGTDYANGNTIGTATVVCVRTADAASTAVSGVDGAGTGGCSSTPLSSAQAYSYKVFQKDSNGNYDAGVLVLSISGWYDINYTYCRKLTMTAGGNIGGVGTTTTSGFALVATSTIASLAATSSAGRIEKYNYTTLKPIDVVVTGGTNCNTDGGSKLDFYFEKYSSTTGAFTMWVESNDISSTTAKSVLVYHGNTSGTDQSNKYGVFGALGEVGVWDMSEDPSGTAPQMDNATTNNNDGTSGGTMTTTDQVTGQVNGALDFDGTDDYIDLGNPATLQLTGAMSVSSWVSFKTLDANSRIISKQGTSGNRGWDLTMENTNPDHYGWGVSSDGTATFTALSATADGPVIGKKEHLFGIFRPSTSVTLYKNGAQIGINTTSIPASQFNSSLNVNIGRRPSAELYANAIIDDVRVYNRALHVQDMKTIYNNTASSAIFWTFGAEETQSTGGIPVSGTLTSAVFDTTGGTDGAGYNSILWKGSIGTGAVRFQFAASTANTGPWNYYGGATCGAGDWFDPGAPSVPIEIKGATCNTEFNNKRYYRYKLQICSNSDCATSGATSPIITNVIVNWSP